MLHLLFVVAVFRCRDGGRYPALTDSGLFVLGFEVLELFDGDSFALEIWLV